MARKTDPRLRLLAAALDLVEECGWAELRLLDVATAAKLSPDDVYRLAPSRTALLCEIGRWVDEQVLAAASPEAEESPRDRLFDVLMTRFDVLNQRRAAHLALLQGAWRDPLRALPQIPRLELSMRWMLELAGLPVDGLAGQARLRLLSLAWIDVLRVWAKDDSEDLARTMAALDKRLGQLEQLANSFGGWRAAHAEAAPDAAAAAADGTDPAPGADAAPAAPGR